MSFIRKKLSRVWDRSNDESSRTPLENPRTSFSTGNTGYSSNTNPSLLECVREASPGKLHKAASTTFQAFSDTIRAKAQIFYTHPSRPESTGQNSPETRTPQKHGQRTPIWSSARNLQVFTDCTNQGGAAGSPGTPTASQGRPAEPAPALDVKIPSSSLAELHANDRFTVESSAVSEENQRTNIENYNPLQLWPSRHTASPQSPIASGLINPAKQSSLMDDPYTEHSYEVAYDSNMFEPCRSASDAGKHRSKNDEGYVSDVESNADPVESDGFSPATIALQSYFTPSTATVAKSPDNGNSLFVKGDQARVHFQRTPSPFQKAKHRQESPLPSAITGDLRPGFSVESPLTVVRSELSMPHFPKDPMGLAERPTSPDSPLAHRSNSFVKGFGCSPPDASTIETAPTLGYRRLPSHVYEADAESAASSPGTPNMGSRHAWNETLADRNDRYLAIHSMSETTYSDEESDAELELSRSSLRNPIHSLGEDGGVYSSEGNQQSRLDIPERNDAKIRKQDSRISSLQKKLEALELLESSCDASTDSECQVSNSPPESTLRILMEANNRASGTVLDELEESGSVLRRESSLYSGEQIGNVVDSVLAKLDSVVAGSPKRTLGHTVAAENASVPFQKASETSVLASSENEGRQSYQDIQEVTNTELDDAEFEVVVQRTSELHQLHLQHKRNLQNRIYDREPRKIISMVGQEDVFTDSSQTAEPHFPGPNVSKVASRNAFTRVPHLSGDDQLSLLFLKPDVVADTEITGIPVMDREKSVSFDIAEDINGSSSVQKVQPADREGFTDALRSAGISRRFLEKEKLSRGNQPTRPVEYSRSFSTESVRTTDSCAVTTSSPLCYVPSPFPTLHVRSSPVRRTSSIIAGLESRDDQDSKDSSTELGDDGHISTPDILETIMQEHLKFENASSCPEHGFPYASSIPAASSLSLAAGTKPQSTSDGYLEPSEPLCSFELDPSVAPPHRAAHEPSIAGSAKTRKSKQRPFPFKLEEDKDEEPSTMETAAPSPEKACLDTENQVLGETSGNKGKKKRKKRKDRKSKSGDASLSPANCFTVVPLGEALGSIALEVSSPTTLRATNDEYQTSSQEKGVWWVRNTEVIGDVESPLAEKMLERGKKKMQTEESSVESEGEGHEKSAEKEGDEKAGSGVKEGVILG